jgi:NAD(P)-dependent dehydrogenase (short-subunit alcohol dehydrogenase family)
MNDEQVEQTILQYSATAPVGRPSNSEEIANTVSRTFLALDENSFIKGMELPIYGIWAQI